MDLYQNSKSHVRNSFEQARNDLVHFQYKKKQRLCFFPLERYSHCRIPNACTELSILRQEFDEYDAAGDVNDALARAHASLREDKKPSGTKAEEREARTRGRADTERRRRSRKERGFHGEGERVNEQRWRVGVAEEDEGEG